MTEPKNAERPVEQPVRQGDAPFVFFIHSHGDTAACISGYTETVSIHVESGDAGGQPGEFEEHMRLALADWFDGASVRLVK